VDPVRNPYAPGAGQRPPELAGRDREIAQFEVVLERTMHSVQKGRERLQVVIEPEPGPEPDDDSDSDYEPEMEELPVSIEVEADLEDTFFDQDAR